MPDMTDDDDPIEEVYAARKKIAEECGYDLKKLAERLMRLQEEHPENLVYEVPKSDPDSAPSE
jgi:hypothetical protein